MIVKPIRDKAVIEKYISMDDHRFLFKLAGLLIPVIGVPFFTILFFIVFIVSYIYGMLILYYIWGINIAIWVFPVSFYAILSLFLWYLGRRLYNRRGKIFWMIYPSLILGFIASLYFSFGYVFDGPL